MPQGRLPSLPNPHSGTVLPLPPPFALSAWPPGCRARWEARGPCRDNGAEAEPHVPRPASLLNLQRSGRCPSDNPSSSCRH